MKIAEQIQNIADAGLMLADSYSSSKDSKTLLWVMLGIEDVLDKGRVFLPAEERENLSSINKTMDLLRLKIREAIDLMQPEEARKFLEDRSNNLRYQFSVK